VGKEDGRFIEAGEARLGTMIDQGGETQCRRNRDDQHAEGDDGGVQQGFAKQGIADQLAKVVEADERLVLRQDIPLVQTEPERLADRIKPDRSIDGQDRR
jgi:hypothetical protein